MGMAPIEVSEKLTPDEMWELTQLVMTRFNSEFEVLAIGKLAGKKQVLVRFKNGLQKIILL